MIKLAIYPSFLPPCSFRLEKNGEGWKFVFNILPDPEGERQEWAAAAKHTDEVHTLVRIARIVAMRGKKEEGRVILDGIGFTCTVREDGEEYTQSYRSPVAGTLGLRLAEAFADLGQDLIFDPAFVNYMELLEGYFGRPPIKLFNEMPVRLRLYGSLSIHHKAALSGMIARITGNGALLVDMTNFSGMGTALYECFQPLKNTRDLTFLANPAAAAHLREMGFPAGQVVPVEPVFH